VEENTEAKRKVESLLIQTLWDTKSVNVGLTSFALFEEELACEYIMAMLNWLSGLFLIVVKTKSASSAISWQHANPKLWNWRFILLNIFIWICNDRYLISLTWPIWCSGNILTWLSITNCWTKRHIRQGNYSSEMGLAGYFLAGLAAFTGFHWFANKAIYIYGLAVGKWRRRGLRAPFCHGGRFLWPKKSAGKSRRL